MSSTSLNTTISLPSASLSNCCMLLMHYVPISALLAAATGHEFYLVMYDVEIIQTICLTLASLLGFFFADRVGVSTIPFLLVIFISLEGVFRLKLKASFYAQMPRRSSLDLGDCWWFWLELEVVASGMRRTACDWSGPNQAVVLCCQVKRLVVPDHSDLLHTDAGCGG